MAAPKVKAASNQINEEEKKEEDTIAPTPDKAVLQNLSKELLSLYNHKAKYEVNKDGSVTFWPTPDCKVSEQPLKTSKVSMVDAAKSAKCPGELEASSDPNVNVVQSGGRSTICSFIEASVTAWSNHYPIRFKPEHIWLLILQGVAVHVDQNAEKLRKKYVNHEGKKTLTVRRDGFVLGSDKNDWEGVIEEFVEQIDANTVKDTVQLFDCDFSGSTMMEKICTKVTIMDICKNYFSYRMMTGCGFPQITLDGTKEDWIRLKQKTSALLKDKVDKEFGSRWGSALLPLLDRFIAAFDGNIDCLFWNSMIKRGAVRGSGGYSFFSGWFNILYPFMGNTSKNRYCVPYAMEKEYVQQGLTGWRQGGRGGDVNDYPTGLAKAPVSWDYHGKELELQFVAGFVGYQQDAKSLEICPNLGWCIVHGNDK